MDRLLAALGLVLACLVAPGETHRDAVHGFQVDVPEGWTKLEQKQDDGSFVCYLAPPGSTGRVLVGVTVHDIDPQAGVDALMSAALAKIGENEEFSELERFELELAGVARPSLRVLYASPMGPLRLEVSFLVDHGRGFALQRAAPPDEFASWSDSFAKILASFSSFEPGSEGRRAKQLGALAERCGSELEWSASWAEAAARAKELGRPVLVVAWLYGGFSLPTSPRATLFMDPEIVELVDACYVPYWLRVDDDSEFARRYGLSGTAFGQGLLVASSEGELLAQSEHASDGDVAYDFLRATLAHHPEYGQVAPQDTELAGTALERARASLARGELERALESLQREVSAQAQLLRARVLRLLRRGAQAADALEKARRAAARESELERAVLLERARLELRRENLDAAREACTALIAGGLEREDAREAQFVLGLLARQSGESARARELWTRLVESYPESRWAWQAAALLSGGILDLELPLDLGWPEEGALARELAPPVPAPLEPAHARAARAEALSWLLAAQKQSGAWPSPADLHHTEARGPDPFEDAISALAVRALLAHRESAKARAAVERGSKFLLASIERRKGTPTPVLYMDYTPWSDAAMLDALADLLATRTADARKLRGAAAELVADLETRRQPHGGWGYYVTGDVKRGEAQAVSMSFTTAAVVLALTHARAAGLDVPPELLESGWKALESMRDPQGVFAYSLGPRGQPSTPPSMVAGAVGRGPVCELALLRAGRSDAARLGRAQGLFLEHCASLAAERGKVIMHAGPQAQGCHYLLFDYAWAAAAWRELGSDPKARIRLTELVLDCRLQDGSFLDTPILGGACGTAFALLALDELAR